MKKLTGVLLMLAVLVTCEKNGTGTKTGSKTELSIWMGSWWESKAPDIKVDFEASYPQYTLNIDCLPINGYFDNAHTAILAGSPPDIMDLDLTQLSTFASRDELTDLTQSIGSKLNPADFVKYSWELSWYNGRLYGMPSRSSSYVYYYNKNMFDEAGVVYPSNSWTYGDLLEMARKITVPGKKYGMSISADASDLGNALISFSTVLWAFGGDFFSSDNKICMLSSPEAINGITYWTELYTKYKVVPEGSLNYTISRDVLPLFDQNQVAMLIFNVSGIDQFSKNPNLRWGIVQAPGGHSRVGGWTLTIPVTSKRKTEAHDYLLWYARPEVQSRHNAVEPANKEAWSLAPPWNSENHKELIIAGDNGRPLPTIANWNQVQQIIVTELQLILQQKKTPAQGANDMVSQIDPLL